MPRPKGPEKVSFKVTVPVSTFAWLTRNANGKPVPTHLAEEIEKQKQLDELANCPMPIRREVADLVKDYQPLDRKTVNPRFKGGKK